MFKESPNRQAKGRTTSYSTKRMYKLQSKLLDRKALASQLAVYRAVKPQISHQCRVLINHFFFYILWMARCMCIMWMVPGCTTGTRQASRSNVVLWSMSSWETSGPGVYIDMNLTHTLLYHLPKQTKGNIPSTVLSFIAPGLTSDIGLHQENNASCHITKPV